MPENIDAEEHQVIFLWNYLNWGGAQIYFLSIVKHAPDRWKFKLVIPRSSPENIINFFKKHGAEIEFSDTWLDVSEAPTIGRKLKRQWRRIHSELTAYRYVRRNDLGKSIVHIETAPWQSWQLIKLLTRKTNVFITMHNSMPPVSFLRRLVWKIRLQYLSRQKNFYLFTSNQDTKNSLKPWVTEDFWNRIKITYTCVDPSEIEKVLKSAEDKKSLREKHQIPADKFVILCVGQFIDRKGRRIFLEAAQKLTKMRDDLLFVWLTQSDVSGEDENLIKSYELGENFRLVRSETVGKQREEILKFFLTADVFALPSYVEGLPIALLEAMALGIPSISTNVNAIPEAVKNMQTGILIEAGDSDQLAKAVGELHDDKSLREKLAVNGQDFVLKHFDERVCAATVLESYESALQS